MQLDTSVTENYRDNRRPSTHPRSKDEITLRGADRKEYLEGRVVFGRWKNREGRENDGVRSAGWDGMSSEPYSLDTACT